MIERETHSKRTLPLGALLAALALLLCLPTGIVEAAPPQHPGVQLVEAFPDVEIPLIMITTRYRGVAPLDVERSVTVKIEDELKGRYLT